MPDRKQPKDDKAERWRGWLSLISMATTLFFGTFLTAWLSILNSEVEEAKLTLDQYGATSTYLELISDESSPTYIKSVALAAMLKFGLLDPEILFSTGYQAEELSGPGILQQLMYEYAHHHDPMQQPIGYLDLPGSLSQDRYRFSGWALDDRRISKIDVKVENLHEDVEVQYPTHRPDIAALYTRYNNPLDSGFHFTLPAEAVQGRLLRLQIRLIDDSFHYMKIVDTEVCFGNVQAQRHGTGTVCEGIESRRANP